MDYVNTEVRFMTASRATQRMGINNLTVGGWIVVILYFVTAISCLRAAFRNRSTNERWTWTVLAFLLLSLAIERLVDFESVLVQVVRIRALQERWYAQRELVQVDFIIFITIVCYGAVGTLLIWTRRAPTSVRVALSATALLCAFVLIRAASLHYIDHIPFKGILEIAGNVTVLLASQNRSVS